jgi:hypothetical protein
MLGLPQIFLKKPDKDMIFFNFSPEKSGLSPFKIRIL